MSTLISKASLLLVPSVYEDGTLYNVLPSGNKAPDETGSHNGYDQTRADFTFSRGSNLAATRVNADGLIEKGRENLLLQSNNFSTWTSINTTETSGQTDKDGGTDAWLISKSASGARTQQAISVTGVQTLSVYAKAGTLNWVALSNNLCYVYFDILNGTIGTEVSNIDASITSVGNGWFYCTMTYNGSATDARFYPSKGDNDSTGTSGNIYIQNAQLEAGLVATDYIETGATTAQAGVLENTPRIDYSSGAGALLLESQRTNLAPYSEYLSGWNTIGTATFTTNHGESPEGANNAMRFQATSAARGGKYYTISVSSGTSYTLSFYAKSLSGTQKLRIGADNGCSTSQGAETFEITETWKRIDTTISSTQTSWNIFFDNVESGSACTGTYLNVDMLVYGFQAESASYPSSYVPTYGSAATRGADIVDGKEDSSLYNDSEGVLFLESNWLSNTLGTSTIAISDGTTSNRIIVGYIGADDDLYCTSFGGGSSPSLMRYDVGDITTNHKIAIKYKANDFALWIDGVERGTQSLGTTPVGLSTLSFSSGTGGSIIYGNMKQILYFPEALSDSELATLTTL